MPQKEGKSTKNRRRLIWLFPLGVLVAVAIYALVNILNITNQRTEARNEYDNLLDNYGPVADADQGDPGQGEEGIDHTALSAINPDYIGWLEIQGTDISYPVVQGQDNDKYLTTTFEGNYNPAGTLFIDVNCRAGFQSQNIVVYGHNMKDRTLFGGLVSFLDTAFLAEHSGITVSLPNGQEQNWRIFAARQTDINDSAYRLSFSSDLEFDTFAAGLGAPEGTKRVMVLSTCTNGENDDERLLVFAALDE